MKKMSIIIPVYFNEPNIPPLYEDLKDKVIAKVLERGYDYELVLVDDGSKDGSYDAMCKLAEKDSRVVNVKLSRNFGSHAAILAGMSQCTGDCVATKAADLQEPSEMILDMLEQYEKGYKVVLAVREDREEGIGQKLFANFYYSMMRHFAMKNMPKGGFDCFLIDKDVVHVLNSMEEKNTSLMMQILWCGFKTVQVPYVRRKRQIGKSRWTLSKKVKLVMDSLLGFSYFPIRFISGIGVILCLGAFCWAIFIFINRLLGKIPVAGYTTLSIIILAGFGLVLLSLGILGEYMWRMFDATRKRPPYIIDNVEKMDDENKE